MILNANTEIIIGPPGTGKTATLIKMATDLVASGVDPSQIGYISFTRQAVREASARIIAATGHDADKFIGFKTLHAMAFWLLGKVHKDITNTYDFDTIAFLPKHLEDPYAKERTKVYSQLYGFHRMTGDPLTEIWGNYAGRNSGTEEDFLEWILLYNKHKKALSKIDFADLIKEFVDRDIKFPFEYLFIDEAQDFAADQWAAAAILAGSASKVIVAGDSDQAVYGWAGAQSNIFDSLEGTRTVLSRSFRVPNLPHILASRVLEAMGRSILYSPKPDAGRVAFIFPDEISSLPVDNGETWFFLCRNNFHAHLLEQVMFKLDIWYQGVSETSRNTNLVKLISRIKWYNQALATGELSPKRKRLLEREGTNIEQSIRRGDPWWQGFDTWPVDRVEYLRRTEHAWPNPKVFIGTFHASKGAEADNVVVYGDCTKRISQAFDIDSPEELRALYVAITRTRNNLFLVQPTGRNGIPWQKFTRLPEDLQNGLL